MENKAFKFVLIIIVFSFFIVFGPEITSAKQQVVGEWGHEIDLTSSWRWVNFQHRFSSTPVVVHRVEYDYNYTDNPCNTRINGTNTTGFYIRAESWDSGAYDNNCPTTGVGSYWMAMEEGIHNVTNYYNTSSRIVEAQSFTMSASTCWAAESASTRTFSANYRTLLNSWTTIPAIWHTIMTANDNDTITTYAQSCGANANVWTTSCVEIGLNGLENDAPAGGLQPCTAHTSDETGGYIAWEMPSGYSTNLCNVYTTGNSTINYTYELCWVADSVKGSQDDPYDIGSYPSTLTQTYARGACLGSNTEIDGANGVYPAGDYDNGNNACYFIAEEDQNGDEEQKHTAEPWLNIFFNDTSGLIFEQIVQTSNQAPTVNSVTLTNTGTPTTLDNISLSYSVTDPEGDPLFNITDWKINGLSMFLTLAYFEFDDGLTTTEHSGRLGYDINSTTATHTATGGHDGRGAFTFDGSTEYLSLDDSSGASASVFDSSFTERTVIVWYKATSVSGTNYQVLYEEGGGTNGANIYIYNGNIYAGAWSESDNWNGLWASTATTAGVWHMAALVVDAEAGKVSLYHDGTFVTQTGKFPRVAGHSGDDYIGYADSTVASPNTGGTGTMPSPTYFGGTIDDFIVIERAVSKTQLDEIYNSNGRFNKITYDTTRGGDTWSVTVRSHDGTQYSLPVTSNAINVQKTAPSVDSVFFDDNDTSIAGYIDLIPNSTQNITCNATVTDIDRGTDVSSASATLYSTAVGSAVADDNSNHYTNSSCTLDSTYGNENQTMVNCTFKILFYSDPGTWQCNVTVSDGTYNAYGTQATPSTVNKLKAMSINVTTFDFGTLKVGQNTTTNYKSVWIRNEGNIPLDLNIEPFGSVENDGYSMVCTAGNIADSFLRYDALAVFTHYNDFTPSVSGTGTNIYNFNLPKQTSGTLPTEKEVRFGLGIPQGASGICTGNIMLTVIDNQ